MNSTFSKPIDRRSFLESMAALTGALLFPKSSQRPERDRLGDLLPRRVLGRTGEPVTMLGVGGWHIGRMSETEARQAIEAALEGGVRFFDSAESYQNGGSERYLGKFLVPKYRDVAFIMTKSTATSAATAQRHLEDSLRRLNTDYLDLWQVHAVTSPGDVDRRIENGVLEVAQRAQEEGKVRYIGFTGHSRPAAHLRMLERTDIFQTCQMPINVADVSYNSFIQNVMPVLVERKLGILAMKTLANGGFFGGSTHGQHGDNPKVVPNHITIPEAIQFVWSLPVSVLITGADNVDQLKQKIDLARNFEQLDADQRQVLIDKVAHMAGGTVEFYKA